MSDYPDFTITALLKGIYDEKPKALAVDVEGNLNALLKGWFGTTPKPLNLDVAGNITAMLKAMNVTTPINVQADAGGNVQMTLIAQELSELINRFKYGAPDLDYISEDVLPSEYPTVFFLAGKGQIYTAYIHVDSTISHKTDRIYVNLDGQRLTTHSYAELQDYNMIAPTSYPMALIKYDETNFIYTVNMCVGYTFESSVEIIYYNFAVNTIYVYGEVVYSVI